MMTKNDYKELADYLVTLDKIKDDELKWMDFIKIIMAKDKEMIVNMSVTYDRLRELKKLDEYLNFMEFVIEEMNENLITINNMLVKFGLGERVNFIEDIREIINFPIIDTTSFEKYITVNEHTPNTKELLKIISKESLLRIIKSYNTVDSYHHILFILFSLYSFDEGAFKLTEQSYEELKKDSLPESTLTDLKKVGSHIIVGEENFLDIIEEAIGSKQVNKYKNDILKRCKNKGLNSFGFFQRKINLPKNEIKKIKEALNSLNQDGWLKVDSLEKINKKIRDELSYSSKGFQFIMSNKLKNEFKVNHRKLNNPELDLIIANLINAIREKNGNKGNNDYKLVTEFLKEQKISDGENTKEIKRRYETRHKTIRDTVAQRLDKTNFILDIFSNIFSEHDYSDIVKAYSELNKSIDCENIKRNVLPEDSLSYIKNMTDSFDRFISKIKGKFPIPPDYKKVLLDEFDKI